MKLKILTIGKEGEVELPEGWFFMSRVPGFDKNGNAYLLISDTNAYLRPTKEN